MLGIFREDPWPADMQVYPSEPEWLILKANGYVNSTNTRYDAGYDPPFTQKALSLDTRGSGPASIGGTYKYIQSDQERGYIHAANQHRLQNPRPRHGTQDNPGQSYRTPTSYQGMRAPQHDSPYASDRQRHYQPPPPQSPYLQAAPSPYMQPAGPYAQYPPGAYHQSSYMQPPPVAYIPYPPGAYYQPAPSPYIQNPPGPYFHPAPSPYFQPVQHLTDRPIVGQRAATDQNPPRSAPQVPPTTANTDGNQPRDPPSGTGTEGNFKIKGAAKRSLEDDASDDESMHPPRKRQNRRD
jgi:hypothetical protein